MRIILNYKKITLFVGIKYKSQLEAGFYFGSNLNLISILIVLLIRIHHQLLCQLMHQSF